MRSPVLTTAALLTAAAVGVALGVPGGASAHRSSGGGWHGRDVKVTILAPRQHDVVGIGARAWAVDVRVDVRGDDALTRSGFTAPQLTGPAAHASTAPFPGTFAPGQDELMPGLVVLSSTTTIAAGPGTNLANLFNLTAVTDNTDRGVGILDTWIVGAPGFGVDTDSTILVAMVDDLDGNGVYDDAPDVVPDADGDGDVDRKDLRMLGVASHVRSVRFHVSGL